MSRSGIPGPVVSVVRMVFKDTVFTNAGLQSAGVPEIWGLAVYRSLYSPYNERPLTTRGTPDTHAYSAGSLDF